MCNYYMARQLPTYSTLPGYPAVPTSPVFPSFPTMGTQQTMSGTQIPSTAMQQPSMMQHPAVGPSVSAQMTQPQQITPSPVAQSPTLTNPGYIQYFLTTMIGHRVRLELLIGTNTLVDRDGVIVEVGINYVNLRETLTGQLVMCDLYSIKFATFYD